VPALKKYNFDRSWRLGKYRHVTDFRLLIKSYRKEVLAFAGSFLQKAVGLRTQKEVPVRELFL